MAKSSGFDIFTRTLYDTPIEHLLKAFYILQHADGMEDLALGVKNQLQPLMLSLPTDMKTKMKSFKFTQFTRADYSPNGAVLIHSTSSDWNPTFAYLVLDEWELPEEQKEEEAQPITRILWQAIHDPIWAMQLKFHMRRRLTVLSHERVEVAEYKQQLKAIAALPEDAKEHLKEGAIEAKLQSLVYDLIRMFSMSWTYLRDFSPNAVNRDDVPYPFLNTKQLDDLAEIITLPLNSRHIPPLYEVQSRIESYFKHEKYKKNITIDVTALKRPLTDEELNQTWHRRHNLDMLYPATFEKIVTQLEAIEDPNIKEVLCRMGVIEKPVKPKKANKQKGVEVIVAE